MKIIVVGGGLFGRIIALSLYHYGHLVTVIDPEAPEKSGMESSGLSAAGCLMKPSWISSVPGREEGLELLNNIIGIRQEKFRVLNKHVVMDDCWALRKGALINHDAFHGSIRWIQGSSILMSRKDVTYTSVENRMETVYADHVIECLGGWSRHCDVRWGISFEFDLGENDRDVEPVIKPWRPFTQLVKFRMFEDMVWSGDGTAVKNLSAETALACEGRVTNFVGRTPSRRIRGMRPYSWNKTSQPCEIFPAVNGQTIVTGGGKNGTIAAAWAAMQLLEMFDGR